jgi:hypothetical protein
VDDGTRLDLQAGDPTQRDASSYRHTAAVTDPDGVADQDATYRDRDVAGDRDTTGAHSAGRVDSDGDGRPDGGLGERLDGDDHSRETYVDRETVVDTDGDGRADRAVRETSVDRDGDGVADDREGGRPDKDRPSLKERLTGRPDNR